MRRVVLAVGMLLVSSCGGGDEQTLQTTNSIGAAADGNGSKIVIPIEGEWSFACGAQPVIAHMAGWESVRFFTQGQSRHAVLDFAHFKVRYTNAASGETFLLVSTGPGFVEVIDGETFFVLLGRFEVGAGPSAGEFFAGRVVLDDQFNVLSVQGNDLGQTGIGSRSATDYVCAHLGA